MGLQDSENIQNSLILEIRPTDQMLAAWKGSASSLFRHMVQPARKLN